MPTRCRRTARRVLDVVGTALRRRTVRRRGGRDRRLCAHHDRRGHAGRPRHRRAAGIHPRSDGARVTHSGRRGAARRQPPPRRRGPGARRSRAAGRTAAPAGRPRPAGVARPGRGAGAGAACASPSSRPATNCARSAKRCDEGCVYDSNRYTLWGMLQRLGVEVIDMGVVRDDPAALEAAFRAAAAAADAVITIGRRQRRRGRPHQAGDGAARRRAVLEDRDAPGPADGGRPHRQRPSAARSCSACRATRWR